jgi:hypothetical protein
VYWRWPMPYDYPDGWHDNEEFYDNDDAGWQGDEDEDFDDDEGDDDYDDYGDVDDFEMDWPFTD